MLLAITNEGKLGLGLLAGAFIVFALLCSFYLSRRNPDFPRQPARPLRPRGVGALRRDDGRGRLLREGGGRGTRRRGDGDPRHGDRGSARNDRGGARRSPKETQPQARRSSPKRAAAAATRSRRPGPPAPSARTSTTRSPTTSSWSSESRTARARCRPSRISSTRPRSRTSPRTSSSPRRGSPRYPRPRPERCPSGRRSATGNRVRVERRVAGSNPALSVGCARSGFAESRSRSRKLPEVSLRSGAHLPARCSACRTRSSL